MLSIACQMGDQDALNEASNLFDQWIGGDLRLGLDSQLQSLTLRRETAGNRTIV